MCASSQGAKAGMSPLRRISIMVKHSGIPQRSSACACLNTPSPGRRECTGTNATSGSSCINRMLLTVVRLLAYSTSPGSTSCLPQTQGENSVLLAATPLRGVLFYICVVASHDIAANSHRVYLFLMEGNRKLRCLLEGTCTVEALSTKTSSSWARPVLRRIAYLVDPCHSQHRRVAASGEGEYSLCYVRLVVAASTL